MNSTASDNSTASEPAATPASDGGRPGFSVVISTHNADRDLPLCLASVAGCDDIVILDAGSTDETVAQARAAGARVMTHRPDAVTAQRNFALRQISFRHPWVFFLESEERMTPELRFECLGAIRTNDHHAFVVASKVFWDGTWLRHATRFPQPEVRLVRVADFAFSAGVPGNQPKSARCGTLHTALLSDPSRGGPDEWLARQLDRARRDASTAGPPGRGEKSFPGRGCLRFIERYFLRRGFLDGVAGLRYCALLAQYERRRREDVRRLRHESRAH